MVVESFVHLAAKDTRNVIIQQTRKVCRRYTSDDRSPQV